MKIGDRIGSLMTMEVVAGAKGPMGKVTFNGFVITLGPFDSPIDARKATIDFCAMQIADIAPMAVTRITDGRLPHHPNLEA